MVNSDPPRSVLTTFPATLQSLHLNSLLSVFRSSSEDLSDYGRGPTDWIDLGSMFPSLTRLEIEPRFHQRLKDNDVAGLPNTLKAFKVPYLHQGHSNSCLWLLPRSLERLETRLIWSYPHSILTTPPCGTEALATASFGATDLLPPHLSFIDRITVKMAGIESHNLSLHIPPTIEIGRLETTWSDHKARLLPSNVDYMSISNELIVEKSLSQRHRTDWIPSVPRSVKSLRAILSITGPSISPSDVSQFPPYLTKLELDCDSLGLLNDALSQGAVSLLWPNTLQSLVIGSRCTPDEMKLLPTTLTSLEVKFCDHYTQIQLDSSYFPPKLIRCVLGTRSTSNPPSFCIIGGNLPLTLKTLGTPLQSDCSAYTRSSIEDTLPPSLTDLTFDMPDYPSPTDAPWMLPSQLMTLKMRQWRVEWLQSLPRQITSLSISALIGLPEALAVPLFDLFEHLPTCLAYLNFDIDNPEGLSHVLEVPSLASLTHLRHLSCSSPLKFAPSTLSYIPRSLRYLVMKISEDAEHLIPSWLHCDIMYEH